MNSDGLKALLEQVKAGDMPVDRALDELRDLPYADLGYAKVDHHRALRSGHPETIFSPGKTVAQIVGIARRLLEKDANIMATRAEREVYEALDCYPTHIDALAAKTGISAGRLAGILLNLELKGVVLHLPGNLFSLKS